MEAPEASEIQVAAVEHVNAPCFGLEHVEDADIARPSGQDEERCLIVVPESLDVLRTSSEHRLDLIHTQFPRRIHITFGGDPSKKLS